MEKYSIKVLGFGDNVVDKYEHIKTMYPGGNCVNFAVYSKMFGAESSAYMGYFGNDKEAEHVIESLEKAGIETIKCRQLEGENGCARVTLINGERIFLGSNEGGIRGEVPFVLDRFDLEYIKKFDLVHSGNYCFTEKELHKIKETGVYVSFDFSDDSTEDYFKRIAKDINFAFCSFDGTEDETKKYLKKIVDYGAETACASRGADGCILYDGGDYFIQKAVPLEKVVDTMGAGDSLIASYLVSYLSLIKKGTDKKEAVKVSLIKAAEFAAEICTIEGAFGYGKKYE
ncbi:PfkB family carbohydrate kinase [Fusobacterium ulcerans]|uniref:PfkB family carbohydrate kinase n=2 Tax=Fusobacterium ulcerans TaxID=861 RepID=UPI001032F827|nr:PfkB family carbohydrate kinase [Fusobacterium ulcerans]